MANETFFAFRVTGKDEKGDTIETGDGLLLCADVEASTESEAIAACGFTAPRFDVMPIYYVGKDGLEYDYR